jgi:hypothetical protein
LANCRIAFAVASVAPDPEQVLLVDMSSGYIGIRPMFGDRLEVWARTYDPGDPGSRGQVTREHISEFTDQLRRWPGSEMGAVPVAPELAAGAVRVAVSGRGTISFAVHRPGGAQTNFALAFPQSRLPQFIGRLERL